MKGYKIIKCYHTLRRSYLFLLMWYTWGIEIGSIPLQNQKCRTTQCSKTRSTTTLNYLLFPWLMKIVFISGWRKSWLKSLSKWKCFYLFPLSFVYIYSNEIFAKQNNMVLLSSYYFIILSIKESRIIRWTQIKWIYLLRKGWKFWYFT